MRIKFAIFALCLLGVLFLVLYVRNEYWKQIAFHSVRETDALRLSEALRYIDINSTQKGANIRDNLTLLNVAVVESTPEVVRILLENGADPNDSNAYERLTPLHRAVYYHRENPSASVIVQMLLDYGADPLLRSESGKRPMDLVAEDDPIKELLDKVSTQVR